MKHLLIFILFVFFWTISVAQTYSLDELKKKFKRGNYSEKVLLEFKNSMEHLEVKPDLYEYIPSEIIAWSFMDGGFLLNSMFRIQNDSIYEISALPQDDAFLAKLNSYVPEKSRFIYRTELWTLPTVTEKLPDNRYLVKIDVRSFYPRHNEPSPDVLVYNLEYTTKDFVNFRLIRLKDRRSNKWIEVDEY